jgi:hypothetical protein
MTSVAEVIGALNFLDQVRAGIVEFSQSGIFRMLQQVDQTKIRARTVLVPIRVELIINLSFDR